MADSAQTRIQNALAEFVDEIDRSRLRQMQYEMHTCAAECCTDRTSSMDQVHRCVESCTGSVTRAQNFVQNELNQFQERLQRGILSCQDKVKEKMSANPSDAEVRRYQSEFESCAVACVNQHIEKLPSLMDKIKSALH